MYLSIYVNGSVETPQKGCIRLLFDSIEIGSNIQTMKQRSRSYGKSIWQEEIDLPRMVDSDHAHDLTTCWSLTGLIGYVGSKPVIFVSNRQGCIAASTYAVKFSALHLATEEAQNLLYMIYCLGCKIPADGSSPTHIFGDNLSVIIDSKNAAADVSKKYDTISFHIVREPIATGIIAPYWFKGKQNTSNLMTKHIPTNEFKIHCGYI